MRSFISFSFCLTTLCLVSGLPVQDRQICAPEITIARPTSTYDPTQLIGQWFILAKTRGPWQGHNWAGSVTNFRQNGEDIEGKYSLFVTGKRYRGCIPGMHATLRHTDVAGRYTATLAARTPIAGNYTIHYLSRDHAITYECYQATAQGCSRNGRVVSLMGRRPQTVPDWLMADARRLVCAGEQIDIVSHEVDCSDKVRWPRARRDISDAIGALDRMNLAKLKKRSIRSAEKMSDLGPSEMDDEECSLEPCPVPCQYGYVIDEIGCQTCECLDGPKSCPRKDCQPCKYGYLLDERGCETCKCRHCVDSVCEQKCEHGFVIDEEGCNTCNCRAKSFCPLSSLELVLECDNVCEYGRLKDEDGCENCVCHCPKLVCDLDCNEYETDSSGCQVCECKVGAEGSGDYSAEYFNSLGSKDLEKEMLRLSSESDESVAEFSGDGDMQPEQEGTCPSLECELKCPNGNQLDTNGCPTCNCAQGCPKLDCTYIIRCDFGSLKDVNGCETCACEVGKDIRGYEGGEDKLARSVIGVIPREPRNFAGEMSLMDTTGDDTSDAKFGSSIAKTSDEKLVLMCPALTCLNACSGKRILNKNGCATCDCTNEQFGSEESQEVLECQAVNCTNQCEAGRAFDDNGCLTCQCFDEPLGGASEESTKVSETVHENNTGSETEFEAENVETDNFDSTDAPKGKNVAENNANLKTEFEAESFETESSESTTELETESVDENSMKAKKEVVKSSSCHEPECWNGPCAHGSKLDKNGCQTCECLRPKRPIMACPFLFCPEGPCRQGWWPDRNGCASCNCKRHELECPTSKCEHECMSGYRIDKNGCDTCECIDVDLPSCPEVECELECDAYREDEFGCEECSCACNETNCTNKCENGFVIDSQDCPTCECQSGRVFDIPESGSLLTDMVVSEPLLIADHFDQSLALNDGGCIEPTTCWDGPCVHGSVPDLSDCETCTCVTSAAQKCDALDCAEDCKFGSYFDRYGCETCRCKPNPIHHCPDLSACALRCANGYRENSRGCEICECFVLVPPQNPCQKLTCDSPCPSYKTDGSGCRTCECGCTEPVCWNGACRYGSKLDNDGCETCACKRPAAPVISCGLMDCRGRECANGYRIDRRGCHTCECIDGKENLAISSITRQRENCTEDISFCPFACMYGNVELNSCLTCECKNAFLPDAKPCPLLDCAYCEFGYIEDTRGCSTCQCKAQVAANLKCIQDCTSVCHYNYVATKDESGCMRCQCIDPPKPPKGDMKNDE